MKIMMEMIFKIICLFLLLGFTPYMAGNIVVRRYRQFRTRTDISLIAGYMIMLTGFELVAVPVIFKVRYGSFKLLFIIYSMLIVAMDVWGTYLWLKDRGYVRTGKNRSSAGWNNNAENNTAENNIAENHTAENHTAENHTAEKNSYSRKIRKRSIGTCIMWIIAAAVLSYMLIMAIRCTWFDGDDAYYVTQSVITQQTGTMYSIQPYRGGSTGLDLRHVMAAFTMWIAYISSACGFHAAIFCHTILPLIVIPITELIYLEIGRKLLGDKYRDLLPEFILFIVLFQIFGSTSIYTSETFLLTRTWQGKSMVANFLFPLMLLLWMEILGIGNKADEDSDGTAVKSGAAETESAVEKNGATEAGSAAVKSENLEIENAASTDKREPWWVMLFLLSACAGVFSSLAVILISAFSGLVALLFAIRRHSFRLIMNTLITLIPAIIYAVIYAII